MLSSHDSALNFKQKEIFQKIFQPRKTFPFRMQNKIFCARNFDMFLETASVCCRCLATSTLKPNMSVEALRLSECMWNFNDVASAGWVEVGKAPFFLAVPPGPPRPELPTLCLPVSLLSFAVSLVKVQHIISPQPRVFQLSCVLSKVQHIIASAGV